jgi:hypothetical protein
MKALTTIELWRRKMEQKRGVKITQKQAADMLGITHDYYGKIATSVWPMSKPLLEKTKNMLASK